MNTNKILINILIVLLVLVAGWLGYSYLMGDEAEEVGIVSTRPGEGAELPTSEQTESEFYILLRRLRDVELDASFLSNATFTSSLQNYTTSLPDKPQGRSNPFADFGTGNVNNNSSVPATPNATSSSSADLSADEQAEILEAIGL